jgi:hypothetical protein
MDMKVCSKCKRELPATKEYFFADCHKKDGFDSACKECKGRKFGRYMYYEKAHPGHRTCTNCKRELPATLEYFDSQTKVKKDGLRAVCKECRGSTFGIKQINKVLESKDGYKYCNLCKKELPLDNFYKTTSGYAGYHDRCKKCDALYRQTENGSVVRKISDQKRRDRKKKLPNTFTKSQWGKCKNHFRDSNKLLHCAYCDKIIKHASLEHFIPLSCGGGLVQNNILPVCINCNSSKNNRNFFDWYPKQPFYSPEREKKILDYLGYKDRIQQLSISI